MKKPAITVAVLFFLIVSKEAHSQKFSVRNYSLGYRVFEINAVGNNPTTIASLLKDPTAYRNFLSTINYNSLYGNPGIQRVHTFYFSTEWKKDQAASRFWEKYSLQTGLLFTSRLRESAGALADQRYSFLPDTVLYNNQYSLVKNQQFFGLHAGINRRFNISKKLKAVAGLHAQGSYALVHYYRQQWDSSTYTSRQGWVTKTTSLPDLKGKNFFQWQAMVPLAVEYAIYQKILFLRLELDLGIVGSRYRAKTFAAKEAHGAGVSIIFQPKHKVSM